MTSLDTGFPTAYLIFTDGNFSQFRAFFLSSFMSACVCIFHDQIFGYLLKMHAAWTKESLKIDFWKWSSISNQFLWFAKIRFSFEVCLAHRHTHTHTIRYRYKSTKSFTSTAPIYAIDNKTIVEKIESKRIHNEA